MNRPRHPAELEAWRLASSFGLWRDRVHPRWKDHRPALDWASARAAHHETDGAPWAQVRQLLMSLEAGARKGAGEVASDSQEDGGE